MVSKSPINKMHQHPLIVLNINVGNGKCDPLYIYKNSDSLSLAKEFTKRNNLDITFVNKIASTIDK